MRQRAESLAAVLLGDDHPEEALVLDVLPGLRRQIAQLARHLPVVDHAAQRLDRAVDECLFLGAEARRGKCKELAPVRSAAEEIALPPYRAGVERFAFGLGDCRQNAAE